MSSPEYVWEKIHVAIECLCGEGPFSERLETATISALIRLEEQDLKGELGEDLRFVLQWTKKNMIDGRIQTHPDEITRSKLVKKMLHLMIETARTEPHKTPCLGIAHDPR